MERLVEAVTVAFQIGRGLAAELHILNSQGELAEVLELNERQTEELENSAHASHGGHQHSSRRLPYGKPRGAK